MASNLHNLKEGILEKDWAKVILAYEGMTGDKILSSSFEEPKLEEVPIDRIQNIRPKNTVRKTICKRTTAQQLEKPAAYSKGRQTKVKPGNTFVDDGTVYSDQILTPQERKAMKPGPRRPAAKTYVVACVRCGEEAFLAAESMPYTIDEHQRKQIADYYCGKCIGK